MVAAFDLISRMFSTGPAPSRDVLSVADTCGTRDLIPPLAFGLRGGVAWVPKKLELPEDYDDGPFEVPELRGEGAYEKIDAPEEDEDDTEELQITVRSLFSSSGER